MKKKGLSIVIIIPLTILSLAIAGVFGYKLYNETVASKASASEVVKTMPNVLQSGSKKPTSGYGNVKAPTPTPVSIVITSSSTSSDFDAALKSMQDDEGKAELDQLSQIAASL